jgi:hypothetical protein
MVIMENGSNKTKVYRNGSLISTGTINYSANGTATNFTVGRVSGSPPGFLNGSVDDIRVYNSVLSSSKLNNIYAFESQYGYTNIEKFYVMHYIHHLNDLKKNYVKPELWDKYGIY